MPKLTLCAEVHRLVPKLFRAEVTRAEHRLPQFDVHVVKTLLCKNFMMSDGRSEEDVHGKIAYDVLIKWRSVFMNFTK